MKKRINVIAKEESFNNLSTFAEVEHLNEAVRTYRDVIKTSIKRADVQTRLIALLEILKRHSCKQIGVSYMSKNTIAKKLEVSYKTVQRLMKKLVDLGMIKQVAMKRKSDMLQTANAVVIEPIKEELSDKTPTKSPAKCPTNKTTSSFLKTTYLNKRKDVAVNDFIVDNFKQANFVAHWVPEQFASLASCFYSDVKTIQEFWRVIRQCNRVVDSSTGGRAFNKDQELTIALRALKEFAMKVKARVKMKKGKFAYFNGIVNKLMDKHYFDLEFMGVI